MPATEQTWRNLKILHVAFAVAAIVLLVATVLMLAADHDRPWKKYARGFRNLETWTAATRVAEQDSKSFAEESARLEAALADARRADLDPALAANFLAQVRAVPADAEAADRAALDVDQLVAQADPATRLELRGDLLVRMRDIAKRARFREDLLAGALKLRKAELDKNRADYELAVSDEAPAARQAELLALADAKRAQVSAATLEFQTANTHRKQLEATLQQITAGEDTAAKAVADHRGRLALLQKTLKDRRPNVGKSVLELPVLDAFNGPLRVDQIWLPQLTLNNNFRDVARFDRCTTCHRGMDKTLPGSPTEPGYPEQGTVRLSLATPAAAPEAAAVRGDGNEQLEKLYGFQFAPRGLFRAEDATVSVVLPESPAAEAGLMAGDVIEEVAGGKTLARQVAVTSLVETTQWGKPLELTVRRGVPQPYSSHPRLDLFVSDSSPHPMKTFGCTICHQGQGSATSFKWASHVPDSPKQAREWHGEHGWFNNHHWIFPMLPNRFEQSSCLKCHHQVVDLEPSDKFPEPPAPKLVEGYHLIRQYGCYGCHEINGWAGPDKRLGPDMRLAPAYHEVAESLTDDPGLAALGPTATRWVSDVRSSPDGRESRERLRDLIERDAAAGADAKLSRRSHELANLLKDPETPGTLPKVGPSLRHAASKLNFEWTYAWLRNPQEFRPSTKMPRFFGLWSHLEGPGLEESARYEPLEIRSMMHYISSQSAPFDFVEPHQGITAQADAARGKKVFQLRGCLACHQHDDFPEAASTHGPNLSRMGAKLAGNPRGREWLYSWLRDPSKYHPKTIMPNVLLEPVPLADGTVSDPAADAVAYLMQSGADWKPKADFAFDTLDGERTFRMASAGGMSAEERQALDELALMYLKERFPAARAEAVLADGLPTELTGIQGDERMLADLGSSRDQKLLTYVGKKTLGKLACYSCHDIPGFEDAKPAGAALADWGRKEASRIAFEQASHFVMHELAAAHGHGGHGAKPGHGGHDADAEAHGGHATRAADDPFPKDLAYAVQGDEAHVDVESLDPDTGYFVQKLMGHEREGFLWQKLRAPRSYDYKKAENKTYNERYRMPQFPFDAKEREAVMTFVLGLVAAPPAPQYVHKPGPRDQARLDGLVVAEQYNCGGCHALEMDRWLVRYKPGALGDAAETADYPFLSPHFAPPEVAASLATDRQGRRRALLVGMPVLDSETGRPQYFDEDDIAIEPDDSESVPVKQPVMLWHDALVDGAARPVGGANLLVPLDAIAAGRHYPGKGGDLARLLFPVVIADEKAINPNVKADDAWGWLPPPLVGEGRKVQPAWLHKFLLNPHPIRPPSVLRMPKFHFGSAEAGKLVDYFAAVDGADSPYGFDPRLDEATLAAAEVAHPGHLDGALKIVTNTNYCVKCHLIGDYTPPGSVKALAPQLARVHERLRPGYVHGWIANPKRFLPYTGMPVNIPYDQPVSQDLYAGTSEQQLDALTDLLMHFDSFAKRNLSLEAFLRQAGPGQRPAAPQSGVTPASAVPPAAAAPSPAAQPVRSGAATGRSPRVPTALN
jgi:cytochrome c551/c552